MLLVRADYVLSPLHVSLEVWHEVEDMTEALRKMQEDTSPEYNRAAAFRRNGAGEVETIMVEGGDRSR